MADASEKQVDLAGWGEAEDLSQPMDRRMLAADFRLAELGEVVLGTAAASPRAAH